MLTKQKRKLKKKKKKKEKQPTQALKTLQLKRYSNLA